MKDRIALSNFLIVLLLAVTCVLSADAASNAKIVGRTYVNNKYGFQISLPDSLAKWSLSTSEEKTNIDFDVSIVFHVMTGPAQEFVNVIIDGTTNSLQNYVNRNMAGCELLIPNWKELSRRVIAISEEKVKGYELIWTFLGIAGGVETEYTVIQWYTIRGEFADVETIREKYACIITGRDTSKNFDPDVFRNIMSTFKFLPVAVSEEKSTATTWGYIKSL